MVDITTILATLWLATLFAYSGALKLADWERARGAVAGYRILPARLAAVVGTLLPLVELGTAGLLLVPATRALGGGFAIALGSAFGLAATSALARRIDVSCGCAGARDTRVNRTTVARAVVVLAAGAAVAAGPAVTIPAPVLPALFAAALVPGIVALFQRRRAVRARAHRAVVSQAEVARLTELLAQPAVADAT